MTQEQAIENSIKKFTLLTEHAGIVQKECFNAIRDLERFQAPAPNGERKRLKYLPQHSQPLISGLKKPLSEELRIN